MPEDAGFERPHKLLTVEEANALLPVDIPILQQLQHLHASLLETSQKLHELAGKLSGGNGHSPAPIKDQLQQLSRHQLQLVEAFQSSVRRLEELGCELKDLGIGLVDFYSLREGETVLLCWKLGEDRIRHWHPLDAGYAGRQPLD
jgi:hypothetical protein